MTVIQVEAASDRVERELNAAFDAVNLPALGKMPTKLRPSIVHDRTNNAVWIRIPKGSPVSCCASQAGVAMCSFDMRKSHCEEQPLHQAHLFAASGCSDILRRVQCRVWDSAGAQCMKEKDEAGLLHPRDRNGRVLQDRYASPGLEDALEEFRAACAAAAVAVREQLRQLASQLQVGLSANCYQCHSLIHSMRSCRHLHAGEGCVLAAAGKPLLVMHSSFRWVQCR